MKYVFKGVLKLYNCTSGEFLIVYNESIWKMYSVRILNKKGDTNDGTGKVYSIRC